VNAPAVTRSLLACLTAPLPAQVFLEKNWPSAAFESHGDTSRLPAYFQQRVLQSAAELATVYLGRISIVRGQTNSDSLELPPNTNPLSPLSMGLTVQFRDVRPYVPGTAELLSAFAAELGVDERAVSLSAYASPPGDGFSLHYDPGEIFSIQLQGRKLFRHAPMREIGNPYGAPWGPGGALFDDMCFQVDTQFPDPAHVSLNTTEMRPGSVLFLPRGTWHCTEASREPSFSVSIAVQPLSACTLLLSRLRTLLLQDAEWRAPIYGAGTGLGAGEAALRRSAELLARLAPIVAQIEPKDLIGSAESAYSTNLSVSAETRFLREPQANFRVEGVDAADGLATVKVWHGVADEHSGRVCMRAKLAPNQITVFEWLNRQTGPFDAGALREAGTGVAWPEIQRMLELAVRGQFVRRLAFRPLKKAAYVPER
jgi:hypothetical protein